MATAELGKEQRTIAAFTTHKVESQQRFPLQTTSKLGEIGRKYFPQREQAGKKLIEELRNPSNVAILLGDSKRFLIGYVYASYDLLTSRAIIEELAIDSEVTEVGGVERMMTELEGELLQRGITSMEGNFSDQGFLAHRVARLYSERLLETREEGQNRFLKIDLARKKADAIQFTLIAA